MHRIMKVGICTLTMTLAFMPAHAQEDPQVVVPAEVHFEVVQVQHAPADQLSITLRNVIRSVRITPDNRTNSLIVAGTREELSMAKQLLASLDVRIDEERVDLPDESGKQVRAYAVQHAKVDQEFLGTLSTLLRTTESERTGLHLALDARQNQVIASGEPPFLRAVGTLVDMLDQPIDSSMTTPTSSSSELSVRLLWLVGGNSGASRSVPEDLKPVVDELSRFGVEDLKLGAQAMVRVSADDDFHTSFASTIASRWTHEVTGRIRTAPEGRLRLDIDVGAIGETDFRPGAEQSSRRPDVVQFQTTVHTTAGHFVVLSMNPVADMESVYVLQINRVE